MASATRSTYQIIPLGPDGNPSATVNPFLAIVTPYYAGDAPPGIGPPIDPPGTLPSPSIRWVLMEDGWALVIGPFDRPHPVDPSLAGGYWSNVGTGWFFIYKTGDKPRPPGPVLPPGVPVDPPVDPPVNLPPTPGPDGFLKSPPPGGGWGFHPTYGWMLDPGTGLPGPKAAHVKK